MAETTLKPPLDVYVVRNNKRSIKPVKTGQTMPRDVAWPKTVTYQDQTFYFTNADFVLHTITYVSVDPNWLQK